MQYKQKIAEIAKEQRILMFSKVLCDLSVLLFRCFLSKKQVFAR